MAQHHSQAPAITQPLKVALIVDAETVSTYVYDLVQWAAKQPQVEITHLIIQQLPASSSGWWQRKIRTIRTHGVSHLLSALLFSLILRYEAKRLRRNAHYADHFNTYSLQSLIGERIYVTPAISKTGHVYRYGEADISAIRSMGADVLIRCGSGILRGGILQVAPFGVLSFHHADNRINRGIPAGFWEVFQQRDCTGFTLQQLTDELDGGNVLQRGQFVTRSYYLLNQAALYRKANYYMKKLLLELAIHRRLPAAEPSYPYYNPLFKRPGLSALCCYMLQQASMQLVAKCKEKLFGHVLRWGVAFSQGHWSHLVMWRAARIKNPPHHFLADPFVIDYNDESYCFVEDYDYQSAKGCISVYKLHERDAQPLGPALTEPFHLSFPYVFEYQSRYYMCPETRQNRDIRIYECLEFPLRWQLKAVAMTAVEAVDSMIFEHAGLWWLFTNIDPSDSHDCGAELFIYYADNPLTDAWQPHPMNPVIIDAARGRNAGILRDEVSLYRVSQRQGFNLYGKAMQINKITCLTPTDYTEEVCVEIEPTFFDKLKGTHHMHSSNAYTVFDFVEYARRDR